MRSLRRFLGPSVVAAIALAPRVASANPLYPSLVQSHLGLSYLPPCTICHTSDLGGTGTATQPFALAMKAVGNLSGLDSSTVDPALDTLQAMSTDSDCNGIPDIQQLKDGRDPNAPGEYIDGSGKTAPPDPGCSNSVTTAYGCGAQLAPASTPSDAAPLLAALATALGVALTRLRPRRPRR
jgi:hypothetical protein